MSTTSVNSDPPAIPAFLTKLRLLVDDEETNDLIYWDPTGSSFHIADGNRLAKELLPLFFKHNNLSSFVRQLNMYGFRKVSRIEPIPAGFKSDTEDMEFRHPFFIRQRPHLLSKIHRKPPSYAYGGVVGGGRLFHNVGSSAFNQSAPPRESAANLNQRFSTASDIVRLSTLIRNMHMTQESMAQQMNMLQSENELLFRELHDLRERHERQSQLIQTVCVPIISKKSLLFATLQLFSFLSAFAKDSRNQGFHFGMKRKALPLAISDGLQSHSGLRLNLPQGYRLDDTSFNLGPTSELTDVPYKFVKRDPDATTPHNQLVALTDSDSTGALFPDASIVDRWENPSDMIPAAPAEPACSGQLPVIPFKQTKFLRRSTVGSFHNPAGSVSGGSSVQLLTTGDPMTIANDDTVYLPTDLASEIDVKPVVNQSDLTLASLTSVEQPASKSMDLAPSPTSVNLADPDDQHRQQLVDLNLSRCTTPSSLLQPDSVDICDLLGSHRNDVESEINIDDLFLASDALNEINNDPERQDQIRKSSTLTTPQTARDSTDLLNSFADTGQNRSFVLSPGPVNLSTKPSTTNSQHVSFRSTTFADNTNQSSTLVPCSEPQHVHKLDENLFGLSWDGPDDTIVYEEVDGVDNEMFHTVSGLDDGVGITDEIDDSVDQLNTGLLPPMGPTLTGNHVKIMSRPELGTTNRPVVFANRAFILGNELIPSKSAIQFANSEPTSLVRVLQPAVSFGLPTVAHTIQPTSSLPSSKATSSPMIMTRCQPKRVLIPATSPTTLRSVSLSPATTCLVQASNPVSTFRLAQTPVHVSPPLVRIQSGHFLRPSSNINLNTSQTTRNLQSRRKDRPVYRPIAPAPTRPTPSGSPRTPSTLNLPKQQNQ